ncbi:MAG: IS200/IS605 family transposase [Phycisphaerae bacterium]|jgi:REP element-mobilizing transposase RayT|nr:IS200/IS605 family transposase [Phycisphaerae bacterium]
MSHTFTNLLIHVVFSARKREPLICDSFRERLWAYMGGMVKDDFGVARIIGGTDNHIHAMLSMKPDVAVSKAMERWKSLSTAWIKKTIPEASDFGWQAGYSAFSVSQSRAEQVVAYIARQGEHHRTMTFEEEFARLLDAHGIDARGAAI